MNARLANAWLTKLLTVRMVCLLTAAVLVVAGGAAQASAASLKVSPQSFELAGPLARVQLAVVHQEDGKRLLDVTTEAKYTVADKNILAVSERGLVRPLADGETTVRIEHAGQSSQVKLTVRGIDKVPVSFRLDVTPVLVRAGCSGGSCHAAQYGQAGFKLSLFGFDPEPDHEAMVRDAMGRRVSLLSPEDSLILQKATMEVSHGGGKRFGRNDYEYEVLRTWLADGAPAPAKKEPKVVDLVVEPIEHQYQVGENRQLRVEAVFSDGTRRDVTQSAQFDSMSDAVASVDATGYVTAEGAGQVPVMVRYQGQAKISMVVVPFADKVDLAGFEPQNFIDELVMQRWQRLGLEPSPVCSDEEFIRRVFIDTVGTLPPPERVEAFMADNRTDKRAQLVDELLGLTGDPARDVWNNEFSAYWALKWGDLLRNNRNRLGDGGMWSLYNWVRASLRENKPVDQFVRELITAQGSVFESGPANYYKIATRPDDLAEATAQLFLGVRMQCAKCHNHPFEVYTQGDYYGLAAFFTRVANKTSRDFGALGGDSVVLVKRTGSIRHPRTGETMKPTPLMDEPIDASKHLDLRRPLAQWLTSPENKLFAQNIANRFWGYLMGSGLVEPIDDMRATNPPSNPELLDALAEHFVESGYDLRQLLRAILVSRTYQLSSTPTKANAADSRFYTHYYVKRLPAEVLLDAIDDVCGTQEKFTGIPLGTRAIELPDNNYTSYFLDTLGRPERVITCECERTAEPNLAQVLQIANGELLHRKVSDSRGRIANLLKTKATDEEILEKLYLAALSRKPDADEIATCREIIKSAPSRKEGLEDVLWALANTREFLFNH